MCPQLSTPYLATSPQVQKLSDRQYQQELCFPQNTHKTETHKQEQKHTENNRMQSFGEVHLELKSCPVLDQQHLILSIDSLPSVHCTQIYKL